MSQPTVRFFPVLPHSRPGGTWPHSASWAPISHLTSHSHLCHLTERPMETQVGVTSLHCSTLLLSASDASETPQHLCTTIIGFQDVPNKGRTQRSISGQYNSSLLLCCTLYRQQAIATNQKLFSSQLASSSQRTTQVIKSGTVNKLDDYKRERKRTEAKQRKEGVSRTKQNKPTKQPTRRNETKQSGCPSRVPGNLSVL